MEHGVQQRPRFNYIPLSDPSREIRLITLIPNADRSANIECTLQTVFLETCLEYTALSYSWGDPSITRGIGIASTTS